MTTAVTRVCPAHDFKYNVSGQYSCDAVMEPNPVLDLLAGTRSYAIMCNIDVGIGGTERPTTRPLQSSRYGRTVETITMLAPFRCK